MYEYITLLKRTKSGNEKIQKKRFFVSYCYDFTSEKAQNRRINSTTQGCNFTLIMSLGITMWRYKLAEIPKTIFVEVKVNVI